MNIKISGSGTIPSGEYELVKISGSGKLGERVKCRSFSSSGNSKGGNIECETDFNSFGKSNFTGNVEAGNVDISGSFFCGGNLFAKEKTDFSGSVKCCGHLKCDNLISRGSLNVGADIEAEEIVISGVVYCGGLINAERVKIKSSNKMAIGNIGGSKISVSMSCLRRLGLKIPLLSKIVKSFDKTVIIAGTVEGDEIELECVKCPRVTGRIVKIGAGCEVESVQYSEAVEISNDAKVGNLEKIN